MGRDGLADKPRRGRLRTARRATARCNWSARAAVRRPGTRHPGQAGQAGAIERAMRFANAGHARVRSGEHGAGLLAGLADGDVGQALIAERADLDGPFAWAAAKEGRWCCRGGGHQAEALVMRRRRGLVGGGGLHARGGLWRRDGQRVGQGCDLHRRLGGCWDRRWGPALARRRRVAGGRHIGGDLGPRHVGGAPAGRRLERAIVGAGRGVGDLNRGRRAGWGRVGRNIGGRVRRRAVSRAGRDG